MKLASFLRPLLVLRAPLAVVALALGTLFVLLPAAGASSSPAVAPPPTVDVAAGGGTQTAVFAGGCFWGVQGVFQHVNGVKSVIAGYAGGTADTADYDSVESGKTAHAESVRVVFDATKISYGQLLQIYFSVAHDPTQLNRQGPDHGTHYRSTVFPSNAEQARVASAYIEQLTRANAFGKALATTVEPGKSFFPAETYHQDYMILNPANPYVVIHELPKIENLKRLFPQVYQAAPVLALGSGKVA
jgi:peptide-methionine (S)-S-oxide reductase